MAKPKNHDLKKHTLNLRAGDMEAMRDLFPGKDASGMVRQIISAFVDNARRSTAVMPQVQIDLDGVQDD